METVISGAVPVCQMLERTGLIVTVISGPVLNTAVLAEQHSQTYNCVRSRMVG